MIVRHRCGKSWKQRGEKSGHCGGCHLTFYGQRSFDEHRRDGRCLNPAELEGWWVDKLDHWHSRPRMTDTELETAWGVTA